MLNWSVSVFILAHHLYIYIYSLLCILLLDMCSIIHYENTNKDTTYRQLSVLHPLCYTIFIIEHLELCVVTELATSAPLVALYANCVWSLLPTDLLERSILNYIYRERQAL